MELKNLYTKFKKNPFLVELKGKMYVQPRANTIVAQGEAIVNTTTGEITEEGGVLVGRRKMVDRSQFAKIYASEIGILFDLSKPAVNVFLYLTKIMNYDNEAYLDYANEYKKVGYKTEISVIKGLRELFTKDIIAPSYKPRHYWINPVYVCKGERFAKYTEYILDTKENRSKYGTQILKEGNKQISEQIENEHGKMDTHTQKKIALANQKEKEKEIKKITSKSMFENVEINPFTGEVI